MGTFLPEGYEPPKAVNRYTKFKDGTTTKIRILSKPIVGWMYWDKRGQTPKPVRLVYNSDNHMRAMELASKNADIKDRGVKHFWCFAIWNYETKQTEVLEITQSGIRSSILDLDENEAWGDPQGYDLTIKRYKDGDMVKYTVNPIPPSKTPKEAIEHLQANPINLLALYYSADPFDKNWVEPFSDDDVTIEEIPF